MYVAEALEFALVLSPGRIHLYKNLEEDLLLEELLHLFAGLGTHAFESCSALDYYDALLRFPDYVYHSLYGIQFLFLDELLYNYLGAVRNLLGVIFKNLLAEDFRGKETEVLVSEHIAVIPGWLLGKKRNYFLEKNVSIEVIESTHRKDVCLRNKGVPFLNQALNGMLLMLVTAGRTGSTLSLLAGAGRTCIAWQLVNLVDHNYYRNGEEIKLVYILLVLLGRLVNIGDINNYISIADGRIHKVHHCLLKLIGRLEYTRSIGENYLVIVSVDYSHYPVAGGLGLGCHNGKFLPYQGVHQSGLAYVRVADDVYKAGAVYLAFHILFV